MVDSNDASALTGMALAAANAFALPNRTRLSSFAPVILDLDGRGITTTSLTASGVRYDLDGDGLADQTSWIGATEAFLFLDRDKNGTVTNAAEFSFIGDLAGAASDLAGLAAFDSNADMLLSAADARFGEFRLWQDTNGNGVAESGEILTLAAAGVRSISLKSTVNTAATVPGDVAIVARGTYTRTNGVVMDLIDATLAYSSAPRDGLPKLQVVAQAFDRKAKNYRLSAKDGVISLSGKGIDKSSADSRAGGLGGLSRLNFRDLSNGLLRAVVLDLNGDGVTLIAPNRTGIDFDIDGDGIADRTGWAGPRDGFLVIDRNGNGLIDDSSELSLLAEDPASASSLGALAKLDSNGDRVIDAKDARFGELRVWVDASGDGVTDQGELKTLAELGIVSIGLDEHFKNRSHKTGRNVLAGTAVFTRANGMTGTVGDVALAFKAGRPPAIVAQVDPVEPAEDRAELADFMPGPETLATTDLRLAGAFPAGFYGSSAAQFASAIASFPAHASADSLNLADSEGWLAISDTVFATPAGFGG